MIARHFPGLGEPWKLTLAQWNGVLDRLSDILHRETPGDPEDPETLKRDMEMRKRQARRQKASHNGDRRRR